MLPKIGVLTFLHPLARCFWAIMIGIAGCLVGGCDTGRFAMYTVRLEGPSQSGSAGSAAAVRSQDKQGVLKLIGDTLSQQGFEKESNGAVGRWYKKGAWVEILPAESGFVLKTHAFGGKRQLRLSEDIERELLRVSRREPGVTITRVPVSKITPPLRE